MADEYALTIIKKYPHKGRISTSFNTFKAATLVADLVLFAAGEDHTVDWPWRIDHDFVYETRSIALVITREPRP